MILGPRKNLLRIFLKSLKHTECFNSSAVSAAGVKATNVTDLSDKVLKNEKVAPGADENAGKVKSAIVAAAFESLKQADSPESESTKGQNKSLDTLIESAKTTDDLLSLMGTKIISKVHAHKIFSIISAWRAAQKINIGELEKDPRFLRLCQLLNKSVNEHLLAARNERMTDDLSIVSDICNEDEAAKLASTLNLMQMVKVLNSLAMKQKRSLTLLRALAFSITENSEQLNIKQCADVLYSLASLNYPDEMLLSRVSADLYKSIPVNLKPAVIRSISTSIGILRYRDTELLDIISDWILANKSVCRPQDLVAFILTLASVDFKPSKDEALKEIVPLLSLDEGLMTTWLDVVWSLLVIGEATSEQVSSVLAPEFFEKLAVTETGPNSGISFVHRLKFLQINGAAKLLIDGYSGPFLDDSKEIFKLKLQRAKEKQSFVKGVFDTLSNLLPSAVYLKRDVDSGFGYLIDGVCQIDERMTPIAIVDKKTGADINERKGTRIALMVYDFHDYCRGSHNHLNGVNSFCSRLIERSGYKVLSVPYQEFILSDKLPSRVQYLETKLKGVLKNK